MQPAPNVEQSSAAQVLTKLLALVSKNVQTWEDLFAEDAVVESLYAPTPPPLRLEGKKAVCNVFKNARSQMQDLRFSNIQVYPTTNPNILWAESHGDQLRLSQVAPINKIIW